MMEASQGVASEASPRRLRLKPSVHSIERATTYAREPPVATTTEQRSFEWSHRWAAIMPPIDVNRFIPMSWVRIAMSIVSFSLLVSDIPRSGLGIKSPTEFYPARVAPDTVLFFEPTPYPVVHIVCQSSNESAHTSINVSSAIDLHCRGWDGDESIQMASAWSYGYDTTSIGLRGFAELYNTSDFPDFLLERGDDPRVRNPVASIELGTVFRMLDGISSTAQRATQPIDTVAPARTLWFASQYQWIDRLYQYLTRGSLQNLRWRTHSLHFQSYSAGGHHTMQIPSQSICGSPASTGKRGTAFSTYIACGSFVPWLCPHPHNSSQRPVSIAEHVPMRLAQLQQKYPDLHLDTVMIATQEMVSTLSVVSRAAPQQLDTAEVVVLTRGRNCSASPSATSVETTDCSTVFVDDYRYERNMVSSTVGDWYFATAALRGFAQFYVWTRLVLLAFTSYIAQPRRRRSTRERATAAFQSIFRIPFQVVVYGSSIPIALYVTAYFVDANFIESKLDFLWTTARGGYSNVDRFSFLSACTMQMRNVWLLALIAKIPVILQTRDSRWRPHMGVRGVRGFAISFASMLSIFGPYRSLKYRRSSNLSVFVLGGQHDLGRFQGLKNEPSLLSNQLPLPMGGSLTMTGLAIAAMLGVDVLMTLVSWILHRDWRGHEILFGSSILVPHSAGTLWPVSSLAIRFDLNRLVDSTGRPSRSLRNTLHYRPRVSPERLPRSRTASSCPTRADIPSLPQVPTATPRTAPPFDAHSRTTRRRRSIDVCDRSLTTRAVVQLINMTMMSDPWALFRLRFVGVMLFVYRVTGARFSNIHDAGAEASVVILPYPPADVGEWTGLTEHQFALIDVVDSREIPLAILLQVG